MDMAGLKENNSGAIEHKNLQRDVGKFSTATDGSNRRALSNINHNIIGIPPPYHRAVKKRCSLEKNSAICEKNMAELVHQPITRRFAAVMTNTRQLEHWSIKKDCEVTDMHTEEMQEEIYTMDEVEMEMEDVAEEQLMDIDGGDEKNVLAVTEYIDDLYDFYKKTEVSGCVSPQYMAQQFDITERMRGILIDWLIEVHYKFELMEETLYLTVNLIDRFLAIQQVVRKKLQLVGVTAMLLACKYEEVLIPVVDDLILISDKAYTRKEVIEMEKLMINTLQFNLSVPTPYVFMRRFLKVAQADKKLELLSFFMIELCLVEYKMLEFQPSLLAAAAIYTAQCTLCGSRQWSKTSEWYTNYKEHHLLECSSMMASFHQTAATGKLRGVHRKYSTFKYGYAAETLPADCLLDDGKS